MEIGFNVASKGSLATLENVVKMAQTGEDMGFDIVGVSDHVVVPKTIDSMYPYSDTGEFAERFGASSASGQYMDQLTTLSYIASITSRIRLLTSVMVLPYRSPVLTAKMLSTIDVLSQGRLIVGCGIGGMKEEFEALGVPPYEERGAVADEYLKVFKELWTNENPSYEGKYCSFSDITFAPRPVQTPHPPLWIGGESPPALRRAAALGDAWFPICSNPRFPVGTIAQLAGYMERVRDNARKIDRDPDTMDFAYSVNWNNDLEAQIVNGERRILTGKPGQIVEDIKKLEDMGVRHLMLNLQEDTIDKAMAKMYRCAHNIRSLL